MTTPRHDTFEIALNPDLQSYSFSELLRDLNGCSNGGHWKIIYASASYLTRTIPGQLLITLQSFIHTIFLFLENFDKKCLFENNYCQFYNELCRCDLIVFLKRSTFHFTPPPPPPPPPRSRRRFKEYFEDLFGSIIQILHFATMLADQKKFNQVLSGLEIRFLRSKIDNLGARIHTFVFCIINFF